MSDYLSLAASEHLKTPDWLGLPHSAHSVSTADWPCSYVHQMMQHSCEEMGLLQNPQHQIVTSYHAMALRDAPEYETQKIGCSARGGVCLAQGPLAALHDSYQRHQDSHLVLGQHLRTVHARRWKSAPIVAYGMADTDTLHDPVELVCSGAVQPTQASPRDFCPQQRLQNHEFAACSAHSVSARMTCYVIAC